MHVILVSGPDRAHKLLVLLDGFEVTQVRGSRDLPGLARLVRRPSVVIVDSLGRFAVLGLLACVVSRSPLAYRVRGSVFQERREILQAATGMLRWVPFLRNTALAAICLRVARAVFYNSEYTRDRLGRHDRATHTAVVHNPYTAPAGGAVAPIELPHADLRLLTATKMNARSKMEAVCDAIAYWIPAGFWEESSVCWVICGGGIHLERLKSLVAERGLEAHIHVLGHVNYLPALYEWCDVFLYPTYLDAFPNATMEAMMCGKPVVTNEKSCGVREQIVDGVNGFVAAEDESVADALRTYRDDPALRRVHGDAGRATVEEHFGVAVQAARLREALESMRR